MKDINLLQTLFLGNQDNDAIGVQPFGFGGPTNRGGFGNDGNQFGNFDGRGRGGRGRGGWRGRGGDGMFRGGQDNGFRGRGGHNHGGPQGGHQFGSLATSSSERTTIYPTLFAGNWGDGPADGNSRGLDHFDE